MSFGAGSTHPSSGANAANRGGNLALAKNGGGTSGTFANAAIDTNLPPNLHTALSYDATHAYLDLLLNFSITTGLKRNQQGVGDALTNFFFDSTGGIPLVYSTLSAAALSQAAGETGSGSQQTTFGRISDVTRSYAGKGVVRYAW